MVRCMRKPQLLQITKTVNDMTDIESFRKNIVLKLLAKENRHDGCRVMLKCTVSIALFAALLLLFENAIQQACQANATFQQSFVKGLYMAEVIVVTKALVFFRYFRVKLF